LRGTRNIQILLVCATALFCAACTAADQPALAPRTDVLAGGGEISVQDVEQDVALEVEVTPDEEVGPTDAKGDLPATPADIAPETSSEDDGWPAPPPCVPGIDPQDPCWYCKCTEHGVRKCFPLGAGSSCKTDDCCMLNSICQPCQDFPNQPCGGRSDMVCVGGPVLSCDSDDTCTSSKLECLGSGCQCTPIIEPEGTSCVHEPDLCTEGDSCIGGSCLPGVPLEKDDGNPCTTGLCIKGEIVQVPISGSCSDGNACTVNDQCQGGVCTSGPPAVCLKGACDATAVCNPTKGCVTTTKVTGSTCSPSGGDGCGLCNEEGWCQTGGESCDDSEYCTDTVCLGNDECIFVPNDNLCDDGDPCTWGDYCADGYCNAGGPLPCGDNNLCTDDVCVGGACVSTPNANLCNDGNACTIDDTCQVALPPCSGPFGAPLVLHHVFVQGWKVLVRYSKTYPECLELRNLAGQPVAPIMCDSGECFDAEFPNSAFTAVLGDNVKVCIEGTGICSSPILVDQPSGAGVCLGADAAQLLCDDEDFCTTDSCDPTSGCAHEPITPCGDLTLIYDDTQLTTSVDGEDCTGEITQIQCTSGSVAVGYSGKSGAFLDELRLRCRHLYIDGDLGMSSSTGPLGAGLGGGAFGPLSCPGDRILVGATIHASAKLHSVNGHCQEANAVGKLTEGFVAFAPQGGGAGGAAKAINCPVGYAVTGMKGPAGNQACAVQFICTRIDML
jgi:hypothetical protein